MSQLAGAWLVGYEQIIVEERNTVGACMHVSCSSLSLIITTFHPFSHKLKSGLPGDTGTFLVHACSLAKFKILPPGFVPGPVNSRNSWNLILAFSRTGKSWKINAGPGNSWKSINSCNKGFFKNNFLQYYF